MMRDIFDNILIWIGFIGSFVLCTYFKIFYPFIIFLGLIFIYCFILTIYEIYREEPITDWRKEIISTSPITASAGEGEVIFYSLQENKEEEILVEEEVEISRFDILDLEE